MKHTLQVGCLGHKDYLFFNSAGRVLVFEAIVCSEVRGPQVFTNKIGDSYGNCQKSKVSTPKSRLAQDNFGYSGPHHSHRY